MTNTISAFKVFSSIDEITSAYNKYLVKDEEKVSDFREACVALEMFAGQCSNVVCDTYVNEETLEITISLAGEYFGATKELRYALIKAWERAKAFRAENIGGDVIRLDFVFDGVWTVTK